MTKKEAAEILEKENVCYHKPIKKCRTCDGCKYFTTDKELHKAIEVAIDILKEGEKDGSDKS